MLRLDPASHTARLTALPISEGRNQVDGIALSPDGSKLAVFLGQVGPGPKQEEAIQVVTLRTRSERTWTWRPGRTRGLGTVVLGANPLSWTADGRTIAFQEITSFRRASPRIAVRMLDTAAPGHSLLSSRVVGRFSSSNTGDAMITPDGTKIVVHDVDAHGPGVHRVLDGDREARGPSWAARPYPHANYGGWPSHLLVQRVGRHADRL